MRLAGIVSAVIGMTVPKSALIAVGTMKHSLQPSTWRAMTNQPTSTEELAKALEAKTALGCGCSDCAPLALAATRLRELEKEGPRVYQRCRSVVEHSTNFGTTKGLLEAMRIEAKCILGEDRVAGTEQ